MQSSSYFALIDDPELDTWARSEYNLRTCVNKNVIEDVEIIPPEMKFLNAYEGKEFSQMVALRNVGRKSALVRIGIPTSNMFRMHPMTNYFLLAPGLTLSKTINLRYSRHFGVNEGSIPICINGETIRYRLIIISNYANVIVEEEIVDFGKIDIISGVVSKPVNVINIGSKNVNYCIDLGRNEPELIVEPLKGILEAGKATVLHIEIIGYFEGEFRKEFWIKTTPPRRVVVIGEFIKPKIVPTYPTSHNGFCVVVFPMIYVGQSVTKTLTIENVSSCNVMFCVKAGRTKKLMLYDEAMKMNNSYKDFKLNHLEGMLAAHQVESLEITYEPFESDEDHSVCFITVLRVDYTDIDESTRITTHHEIDLSEVTLDLKSLTVTRAGESGDSDSDNGGLVIISESTLTDHQSFNVCLYGDKETPRVQVRPTRIILNNIFMNDIYMSELSLTNLSCHLPIDVVYQKACFVSVEPNTIRLNPHECQQLSVKIHPKNPGFSLINLCFKLVVVNIARDVKKKITIGMLEIPISFTSIFKKPTDTEFATQNNLKDLRPRSSRFKESRTVSRCKIMQRQNTLLVPCFGDLPFDSISKTMLDQQHCQVLVCTGKEKQKNCYTFERALNKMLAKQRRAKEEIMECFFVKNIDKGKDVVPLSKFIPLSAMTLHSIKIVPKFIRLQRVAPVSKVEHYFQITNENPFPIHVHVTSVKPGILFKQGQSRIVEARSKSKVHLICQAGPVGRYTNVLQIIINFIHIHAISFLVEVVAKTINASADTIVFESDSTKNIKFITLYNRLNSSISFVTEMTPSRFTFTPSSGKIPQQKNQICAIQYQNTPGATDFSEVILTSEGGQSQLFHLSRLKQKPKVEIIPEKLVISNLPLNLEVEKRLKIKNKMNYDICFVIENPAPIDGVSIYPHEGIIPNVAEIELVIKMMMTDHKGFQTEIRITLDDNYSFDLRIEGMVTLPEIEISPDSIVNRELIPWSYKRNVLYVMNRSNAKCLVRFGLDKHESFRLTEKEEEFDISIHNSNLTLLPGEVKTLYLHCSPMDALSEHFLLPIILNNLENLPFTRDSGASVIQIHEGVVEVPRVLITAVCSDISIKFSTLRLKFYYSQSGKSKKNILHEYLTVKNKGRKEAEFCIRLDNLSPQFELKYHSGNAMEFSDISIVCRLHPEEFTVFSVNYLPKTTGDVVNNLPIYLRNYFDGCIFNYLRLIGFNEPATMKTTESELFLNCTPIGFSSIFFFNIETINHRSNCEVSYASLPDSICVTLKKIDNSAEEKAINVKVVILLYEPASMLQDILFNCTCGAQCTITLAFSYDNCYLSYYAFSWINKLFFMENMSATQVADPVPAKEKEVLLKATSSTKAPIFMNRNEEEVVNEWNNSIYPFFIVDSSAADSDYVKMMKSTLKAVERWISSQGFFRNRFFHIPETIALPPKEKKRSLIEPSVLTFLIELAGAEVREASLTSKVVNHTKTNIALHFMITYQNLVIYLKSQGAIMPHVMPEFLLTYEDYEIIETHRPDLLSFKRKLDEPTFIAYSTRCYIDLVLQSIKIFVLNRIVPSEQQNDANPQDSKRPSSPTEPQKNAKTFSNGDYILLRWLQYHFDSQKNQLWELENTQELKAKKIVTFEDGLQDSLVFACVTVAFCPYMKSALSDMHAAPESYEQLYHNACSVIEAWNILNLSFVIEPEDIIYPIGINMMLLTLYLYEVLPPFFPNEMITIEAELTEISTAEMIITNDSNHKLEYAVLFFDNEIGSFSTVENIFNIPPEGTETLVVHYQAKKVNDQKAVLVLSGERAGQKYGRSKAVILEGITKLNNPSAKFQYHCECYKVLHFEIRLFNPYRVPDTYEMYYIITSETGGVENDGEEIEKWQLLSWKDYVLDKVPKQIYTREYEFSITNVKQGLIFKPIICCQAIATRTYKMFMVGKNGDWSFHLKLIPAMSRQIYSVINVSLPRDFDSQVCTCTRKSDVPPICPKTISIKIPSKNNLFLISSREMFIACTDETFMSLWIKDISTRAVFNILGALFRQGESYTKLEEYEEVFQLSHTYTVSCEPRTALTTSEQVTIEDVTSDGSTEILVHANFDTDHQQENFFLELESLSKLEKRIYKLHFFKS